MPYATTDLADPQLIRRLFENGVGVCPTDTVYGLVARAEDEQAIRRLYAIKKRELSAGTIIAASIEQLAHLGFSRIDLSSVEHHWPNPVSIVLPADNIANYLKVSRTSLPVRVPNHPALLALLEQVGPLMTTSANAPGEPTSTTLEMARSYFGDAVDFYVDGGDLGGRPPSTIIGIENGSLTVYRAGAYRL